MTSSTTAYPMRLSPDGTQLAIRSDEEPYPWRVAGRQTILRQSDEQVEGWTPLVPQLPACDELARLGDSPRYGIRLDNNGGPDSSEAAWERTQRMVVSPDKYARIAAIIAEPDESTSTSDTPRRGVNEISQEIITVLENNDIPVDRIDEPQSTDVHTIPYRWHERGPGSNADRVYQWKTEIFTDRPDAVAALVRTLPERVVVVAGHPRRVIVYTNTPVPQA